MVKPIIHILPNLCFKCWIHHIFMIFFETRLWYFLFWKGWEFSNPEIMVPFCLIIAYSVHFYTLTSYYHSQGKQRCSFNILFRNLLSSIPNYIAWKCYLPRNTTRWMHDFITQDFTLRHALPFFQFISFSSFSSEWLMHMYISLHHNV